MVCAGGQRAAAFLGTETFQHDFVTPLGKAPRGLGVR